MQNTALKNQFLLDPSVIFLNFGSFGACPKPIFDDYQKWQLELEREPVQFIAINGLKYLQQSREALGKYLNCDADDLVYFPNPSHAVNMVAQSLDLKQGDEVLTTDLEYGACDKAWKFYCEKAGAKYVRQPVTLPLTTKEKFLEDFFKGITGDTKVIFISHITSSTALILPIKEICEKACEKGILTFVDGAHAPGHIPLDLQELDVDLYTGACHKWMMTAKGSSFLYAKKEQQPFLDPLVVSWGFESAYPSSSKFIDYHQGQGTRDFSAFLTIPKALEFMRENDWENISKQCKELVRQNAPRFCELLDTEPLCPLTEEFLGQMFSIKINAPEPEKLQRHLFEKYNIEIPVMLHDGTSYIRYSINAFNSQDDLDRLYDALKEIRNEKILIK